LGRTPGAEVQKPLATVVIGGLISTTLLTLAVLPGCTCVGRSKAATVVGEGAVSAGPAE
jgi:heavy metal efflux system protein